MFPLPWLLYQAKSSLQRFREVVCFLKDAENTWRWVACDVQAREAGTKSTENEDLFKNREQPLHWALTVRGKPFSG